VLINDTTPPPVPIPVSQQKFKDGLVVHWLRDNVTRDLAGYWIEYWIPDWSQQNSLDKNLRVLPAPKSVHPLFQSARLGGLFGAMLPSGNVSYCIHAYDASGNLSGCTLQTVPYTPDEEPLLGRVTGLLLEPNATNITAIWNPPAVGSPDGYLVSYARTGCTLPGSSSQADEGPSPLLQPGLSQTLTGLTVGQRYRVGVRSYTRLGETSSEVSQSIYFGNPSDTDVDSMPDSWEAVFGVSDPLADDDLDGLANLGEYDAGAFPTEPDSDRDGFYDSVEVEQGTNPCGPGALAFEPENKLAVVGSSELVFHNPTNLAPVDFDFLTILNLGAGTMDWEVQVSEPWIKVSQLSGQDDQPLLVQADPAGLPVGLHAGTLTINTARAALKGLRPQAPLQEMVTISVILVVLPIKMQEVYLPMVVR
jgi:hypothetical protein